MRGEPSDFNGIKTFNYCGDQSGGEVFWTYLNNVETLILDTPISYEGLHEKEKLKELCLKNRDADIRVIKLAPNLKILTVYNVNNLNLYYLVNLEELTLIDLPEDGSTLEYIFDNMKLKTFYCDDMLLIKQWVKQELRQLITTTKYLTSTIELLKRFPCKYYSSEWCGI